MAERRPLIEGLNPPPPEVVPELEEQFVFGGKTPTGRGVPTKTARPEPPAPLLPGPSPTEARPGKRQHGSPISRVPLTTRVREDFATALKRASLERQLNGEFPNTLQEILETALEPWLKDNGYLS
jgi:hypothetical protein